MSSRDPRFHPSRLAALQAACVCVLAACTAVPPMRKTGHDPERRSSPSQNVYFERPLITATLGAFATGIALADMNRDGWLDMVVSNGNDVSPQPMMIYFNTRSSTAPITGGQYPLWYSGDIAYRAEVAAGDVDGDGWLDLAVAVPMSRYCNVAEGGVAIYMNHGGVLDHEPSWWTQEGFGATGVAFADVDADGWLDLVAASAAEGATPGPCPPSGAYSGGYQRIYLNHNGALSRAAAWTSKARYVATDVLAADIDQDGWMDLGFAAPNAVVFFGTGKGQLPATTPQWTSADTYIASYSLDAGWVDGPAGGPLTLAVTSNCLAASDCRSNLYFYRPVKPGASRQHVWMSARLDNASKLVLADVNADGDLDVALTQMGVGFVGAPVLVSYGPLMRPAPPTQSLASAFGQAIEVADLRNLALTVKTQTFQAGSPRSVFTLADRRIQSVSSVEVLHAGGSREAPRWAWAPGANWLSLAAPLGSGDRLRVTYQLSPILDIAAAVATPSTGNYLFYSQYNQGQYSR